MINSMRTLVENPLVKVPMSSLDDMLRLRISAYEQRYNKQVERPLGAGHDGTIFVTQDKTAIKFHTDAHVWRRELDVYEVLTELSIEEVAGHEVPQFIAADEELLTLEMTIVDPPFLLDFGSARPEEELPDFNEDVWHDWQLQKAEQFGPNWRQAQRVMDEFSRLTGYTLFDIHPGNIRFTSDQTSDP